MSEELENGKVKPSEMLADEQRATVGTEGEQLTERTRESEIKANIDFWNDPFWKEQGIEVDADDIEKKIEELPKVEGFDWYIYVPNGLKMSLLWSRLGQLMPVDDDPFGWDPGRSVDEIVGRRNLPQDKGETYAIAARYERESGFDPERDHLDVNIQTEVSWEKIKRFYSSFMSPPERVIAEMRWYSDNGNYMDDQIEGKGHSLGTTFPGWSIEIKNQKSGFGMEVNAHNQHILPLFSKDSYGQCEELGRRVILKDTVIEQEKPR